MEHTKFESSMLQIAIEEAEASFLEGGLPIGSVLVHRGKLVSRGRNLRAQTGSTLHHAEMTALANAGRQPPEFYRETVLYTTLSPCPMCTGAMILYGIPKVVIGTPTVREWGEDRLRELGVEVVHTRSEACAELLSRMITQQRELIRDDGGNFFAQAGV